jgi:CRISPR-associated endonuclease/helicase Cas3
MAGYYQYWGKAEKDGSRYHLLPYHCLDVAAVAAVWWNASPALRQAFAVNTVMSTEQLRAWVLFFVALHDYGKFDVRFQLRVKYSWQLLYSNVGDYQNGLPSIQECKAYYHGEGGLSWFQKDFSEISGVTSPDVCWDQLDDVVTSCKTWELWKPWIEAIAGHHGFIKDADYVPATYVSTASDKRLAETDRAARIEWLWALETLFLLPAGLSLADTPPSCPVISLAGFCSVADWLGSRCDDKTFPFCQEKRDLREYFEERCVEDAPRVLKLAGVIGRPHVYDGVAALLDPKNKPRSLQTMVDKLPLKAGLTLAEAPTGSGKTETALAYAWRLVAAGLADSIVFALPTQATANAMLGRLQHIAPLLFDENPNLLLAHGTARFNSSFTAIKNIANDSYEEDGLVQCSQWLAESRKRVFLGQIGVCTIDQVLISVLPVKHRFIRGFGVGRSVLIVDEVHAYDAYMYGLLEEVLRQQKASGGSAILLSATLPERQRQKLCHAWGVKLEQQGEKTPYPLITWTGGDDLQPYELDSNQLPDEITVKVEPIRIDGMMPDEALLSRIVMAADAGAQVVIVCNFVDVAQRLADTLRSMTSMPVDLFHARYCYVHRQRKEKRVIMRFGPKGKRKTGRILVATQVVEQSLDVDFDWLITQLCPVDLLFQRMGRLHRHNRNGKRPPEFEQPLCTVLMPEGDDFGLHGYIYQNTRILWRTMGKIVSAPNNEVIFPAAYRTWIESVYQQKPWQDEPEGVTAAFESFEDNVESVKKYLAAQMLERAKGMTPFNDTDENVLAVTRDGEMNSVVVPFCRVPEGRALMDGTVFEFLDEYQQLEALSLNSVGVPKSWSYYLDNFDEKRRYWLELEQEGEGYQGISKGVTFRYHKDKGLEKEK